jgi:polyisoprenoid-binding protein YceI
MHSKVSVRALALGLMAAVGAASALAQPAMPVPEHDYKAAPAGTYALDPMHTGLIARVPHFGFSYSVERFTAVQGALTWDPANPGQDKLTASVEAKSITPIPIPNRDFAGELATKILKADTFPTATFASGGFHPDSPTSGKVDGDLTIMGVTKHVVFDVTLVGTGKGFKGPVIGVTARTQVDPRDYGLPPFITGPIELTIDSEFDKQAG